MVWGYNIVFRFHDYPDEVQSYQGITIAGSIDEVWKIVEQHYDWEYTSGECTLVAKFCEPIGDTNIVEISRETFANDFCQ